LKQSLVLVATASVELEQLDMAYRCASTKMTASAHTVILPSLI